MLRKQMPDAPLLKIKYQISIYDVMTHKSEFLKRIVIKRSGEVVLTECGQKEEDRIITRHKIDSRQAEEFMKQIQNCIFSENSMNLMSPDDIGRRIFLYYEGEKSIKLENIYYCENMNTEELFEKLIQFTK